MEWGGIRFPICPDTSSFKWQKPEKSRRKQKGTKEIEAAGGSRGHRQHGHATPTTGCGENHRQPVVVSGAAIPSVPERCVLVLLFGLRVVALDCPPWA